MSKSKASYVTDQTHTPFFKYHGDIIQLAPNTTNRWNRAQDKIQVTQHKDLFSFIYYCCGSVEKNAQTIAKNNIIESFVNTNINKFLGLITEMELLHQSDQLPQDIANMYSSFKQKYETAITSRQDVLHSMYISNMEDEMSKSSQRTTTVLAGEGLQAQVKNHTNSNTAAAIAKSITAKIPKISNSTDFNSLQENDTAGVGHLGGYRYLSPTEDDNQITQDPSFSTAVNSISDNHIPPSRLITADTADDAVLVEAKDALPPTQSWVEKSAPPQSTESKDESLSSPSSSVAQNDNNTSYVSRIYNAMPSFSSLWSSKTAPTEDKQKSNSK